MHALGVEGPTAKLEETWQSCTSFLQFSWPASHLCLPRLVRWEKGVSQREEEYCVQHVQQDPAASNGCQGQAIKELSFARLTNASLRALIVQADLAPVVREVFVGGE